MRIDAYNAVSQVYKTSAYAREKGMAVKKTEKDKYELSDTARLYNTAKAAVSEDLIKSTTSRHVLQPEHII